MVKPIRCACALVGGDVDAMRQGLGHQSLKNLAEQRLTELYPELWAPQPATQFAALDSAFQTELARLRLLENAWANVYWQVFLSPMAVAASHADQSINANVMKFLSKAKGLFTSATVGGPGSPPYRFLVASFYAAYLGALAHPADTIKCDADGRPEGLPPEGLKTVGWWFGSEPAPWAKDAFMAAVGLPSIFASGPKSTHFGSAVEQLAKKTGEPVKSWGAYGLSAVAPPGNHMGPASRLAGAMLAPKLALASDAKDLPEEVVWLAATWGLYRDLWTQLRGHFWKPGGLAKGMVTLAASLPASEVLPPLPCFGSALHKELKDALTASQNHASPELIADLMAASWLRLRRLLALRLLLDRVSRGELVQLMPLLADWASFDGLIVAPWLALQSATAKGTATDIDWSTDMLQVWSRNARASSWAVTVVTTPRLTSLGEVETAPGIVPAVSKWAGSTDPGSPPAITPTSPTLPSADVGGAVPLP